MPHGSIAYMVPVVALAVIGGISADLVIRNAPAFSQELRRESVIGDWRVPSSEGLFDQSVYYFNLGFGFLQGDAAALLMGETELPSSEVFEARIGQSVDLFETSLATAPGRVETWTSLGWAHIMLRDAEAATTALHTSWRVAPFNRSEALDRLALADAITEMSGDGWIRDDDVAAYVLGDLMVLETHDPIIYRLLLEQRPMLRDISDRP